jgi:hypothetical protein
VIGITRGVITRRDWRQSQISFEVMQCLLKALISAWMCDNVDVPIPAVPI